MGWPGVVRAGGGYLCDARCLAGEGGVVVLVVLAAHAGSHMTGAQLMPQFGHLGAEWRGERSMTAGSHWCFHFQNGGLK